MLEVSLWHQGLIAWQLTVIEATLPVVEFMVSVTKCFPEASEAESIGSAFFISGDSSSNARLRGSD